MAVVVSLGVAAGALAGSGTTKQTYRQSFSEKGENKSTGMTLAISATDPANPRNAQPKRITGFQMTLPSGSRIDLKATPKCDADPITDCPPASRIGTGTAAMRSPTPGTPDLVGDASVYNTGTGVLTIVDFRDSDEFLQLESALRRTTFRTDVPRMRVNGEELVLSSLELEVDARARRLRGKRHRLMATPRECEAGGWLFRIRFEYEDGTLLDKRARSACRR